MKTMDALKTLARLTQVEALKFWRKPVARAVLVLMLVGPIMGEALLVRLSPRDAIFPRVAQFLFSGDLFLFIALISPLRPLMLALISSILPAIPSILPLIVWMSADMVWKLSFSSTITSVIVNTCCAMPYITQVKIAMTTTIPNVVKTINRSLLTRRYICHPPNGTRPKFMCHPASHCKPLLVCKEFRLITFV